MIKKKIGLCSDCGKETFLIAGRCQYHYWLHRRKIKSETKPSLFQLFEQLWEERPHMSYLSGIPLGRFSVSYFAHVLSRKQFPCFSYNPKNIVLLTIEEHRLLDQGTIEQRDQYAKKNSLSWDKLFSLRDELIKEYPC